MRCPSCARELPDDSRFCSGCGSPLLTAAATLTQVPRAAADVTPSGAPDNLSEPPPARFVPGTVLSGRYRIVAQVGRGGMGEVYRAEDMRLGQTVALKFLPEMRGRDPDALARLHREVRIARQISHPNVCRVFDIGDTEGIPFLTMEFVDGEDLSSLLTRIGRLPPDKAIQLAKQLCAGLAEAHSFGVLHRDLKPANIMLDGRGNARITDFGLAITAGEARGEDAWAGTPAYMSPEQLSGEAPTVQSDIYALGLVLYELFTGKEAYPGVSVDEIRQQRQKGAPPKISGFVKGLDPEIERSILRCLEKDPRSRPRTVLHIAAALPGGDPLSAAIAAGETPSPEMVAAAADQPLVPVGRLWLIVGVIVTGLVAVAVMVRDGTMIGLAPLDKSPAIMADRAREVASQFGYPAPPADRAGWYEVDEEYVRDRAAGAKPTESKRQIWLSEPGAWRFVYRQSPKPLATLDPIVQVNRFDPPNDLPGMLTVILDAHGRPLRFSAVPADREEDPTPAAFDWASVLSSMGLKDAASASPAVIPRGTFDSVSAWSGTLGEDRVHVVAAAYRGRPTYYEVYRGQTFRTRESAPEPGQEKTTTWPEPITYLSVVAVAFFLARRNMRAGRVDRKGAVKLAAFVFAVVLLQRVFMTHFVANAAQLRAAIVYGTGVALSTSLAMVYLSYLALEPYFRRRWPRMMISWSRVLAGRFSDARVGADLVTGIAAGVVIAVGALLPFVLATWLNLAGQIPFFNRKGYNMVESVTTTALRGFGGSLLNLLSMVSFGVVIAMLLASVLLLARLLLRRDPLAALALGFVAFGVFYKIFATSGIMTVIGVSCATLLAVSAVLVLFRFGLLALSVSLFVGSLILETFLPLDFSRWYVWSPVLTLAVLAALVGHGFRAALAGRPLFGRDVLVD